MIDPAIPPLDSPHVSRELVILFIVPFLMYNHRLLKCPVVLFFRLV